MPEERDLAHEADMRALMTQQLRDNINAEEAAEECAEIDARNGWTDDDDFMGDPDEYDICQHCLDDGMDPDCDYLLPCPVCQGEQQP